MTPYPTPSIRRHVREVLPALYAVGDGVRSLELARQIQSSDRWNSFDRFHETTRTLRQAYQAAGATVEVESIPTGGRIGSGRWVIHEAIDIRGATLEVVSPISQRLADYTDNPWHVAQCGAATPSEGLRGELVVIDDPQQAARLAPGQLRGRFVLTRLSLRQWHKSFVDAGAQVIIGDQPVPNLPDAVAWTKLGWGGISLSAGPTRVVAFALSENQGSELRRLHESCGGVTLHVAADIHRYVGDHDVVSGLVQGRDDTQEEVWAMAHSSEPGAVDNASGVASCVEIAHILEASIAKGLIPRPRRTIRLINAYECYGFFAYLERHKAPQTPLAGVNLDAVGIRPENCDGWISWHATVPGSAGFVDRVGEAILRGALGVDGAGYRYTYEPFVSTSDTLIGDPRYGFPCPWLTTQRKCGPKYDAYHSSADTLELLSEPGLRLCASAMACYLHYLADAGTDELLELADAETRHFDNRLNDACDLAEARYLREHHRASIARLERWMWGGNRAVILDQLDAHRRQIDERIPEGESRPNSRRGGAYVPRRTALLTPTLENTPEPLAQNIRHARLRGWALFWADGKRTLAQIAEMLSVEYGQQVTLEHVAQYFKAHAELGYIELMTPRNMISKSRLVRDLRELGLTRGMDVMVHSSLAGIGHVAGGPETVVDALLEVIGQRGTLLMPSFNHGRVRVYNPLTSPTTNGAIPDAMWRRRDAVRSDQPTHPIAAIGPNAQKYCADHARLGVWSAQSPIGRLINNDGYILALGVTHRATTAMHVAEIAVPCRCIDQFASTGRVVQPDGSVAQVSGLAFREKPCPVSASELDRAMRCCPDQRRGMVGNAETTLVKAQHVYQERIRQLRDVCPTCSIRPAKPRE